MSQGGQGHSSYKCTICGINWPYISAYRECPRCRTNNSYVGSAIQTDAVLDEQEAQMLSRYFNFEYYCETEHIPSERLDPELESRIDEHIAEILTARQEGREYHKHDDFNILIAGQFDDETRGRIIDIERIMGGREHYENT
jgi:hypothetical protein